MNGKERFQRIHRRLNWVAVVANACGLVLIIFYFVNIQDSLALEPGGEFSIVDLAVTGAIFVGLMTVAELLSRPTSSQLKKWYLQTDSQAACEPAPLHVRRQALNMPLGSAGINLLMWVLASFIFGILSSLDLSTRQFDWGVFLRILLGVCGIAGPITSVLYYFAVERVWRSEVPFIFAGQDPTQTPAFQLTVKGRVIILFVMGATPLLLLAILSYTHAVQIAHAPQPATLLPGLLRLEFFLVGVGILVAVILALTLGASLVEALETLSQRMTAVKEGHLDERVQVVSNDEIGVVSSRFNSMAASLQSRDTELKAIYQISQDITANLELDQTLQTVLEQVRRMIACDAAEICLYDEKENILRVQAWASAGRSQIDTTGQAYHLGEGYSGWLGENHQSLLVSDVDTHTTQQPVTRQVADGVTLNSYLGVPLIANQKLVGTLELAGTHKSMFDEHARQLLETISPQAAIAIQNAAQVIERERQLKEQIQQLRIEIDEVKKAKQVAEITETEYFKDLRVKARQMRKAKSSK